MSGTWHGGPMLAVLFLPLCFAQAAPSAPKVPDGHLLVLDKSEARADLIDLESGKVERSFPTGEGPHEVALHPSGKWAVVSNYGAESAGSSLSVLDLSGPESPRRIDLGAAIRPHGLVFGAEGRVLWVTAEKRGELWKVDFASGKVLARVATGAETSHMVVRTPSGRLFVANIGSGSVTPIEADGHPLPPIPTGAGAEGIAVSPDGKQLWVTNRAADTVSVLDPRNLELLKGFACPSFPIRVAITPDSRLALVSCARSGAIALFRTSDFAPLGRIRIDREAVPENARRLFGDRFGKSPIPIGLTLAPDGRRAWVANAGADLIAELDLRERKVLRFLEAGKEPDGIVWLP